MIRQYIKLTKRIYTEFSELNFKRFDIARITLIVTITALTIIGYNYSDFIIQHLGIIGLLFGPKTIDINLTIIVALVTIELIHICYYKKDPVKAYVITQSGLILLVITLGLLKLIYKQ